MARLPRDDARAAEARGGGGGGGVAAEDAARAPAARAATGERKQQRAASASMADEELEARLKVDERLDCRRGDGSPRERDGKAGGTAKSGAAGDDGERKGLARAVGVEPLVSKVVAKASAAAGYERASTRRWNPPGTSMVRTRTTMEIAMERFV